MAVDVSAYTAFLVLNYLHRGLNIAVYPFHLQERLNQVLMEKKKESRSGMEIMNLLQVTVYFVAV